MPLISVNPATGKRIASYRTHSAAEVEDRLARAAKAQRSWAAIDAADRARLLGALAAELRTRRDALAALATDEMGKPVTQARAEVEKCATLCDVYAARGPELLRDQTPPGAAANARVMFQPLGVILAIMPWNFPYWQVLRAAVPTLLAGNTVVLKHAPTVTGCAMALEKVFAQAGFPRGVLSTLVIDTRPIAKLIADPRIAGVTLTGSTRAGKIVGSQCGAAMKPAVFELGGSDPLLVLDDADLDHAAEIAAQARLINSGQSCICAKRIIVAKSVRREFEARFVERFTARRVGDPTQPETDIGPLARADLRDHLHAQVLRARRQGAKVLLGGTPRDGTGFFYEPTILSRVRPGNTAFDEETFGPVAALIDARDDDHAIALANASSYGLGAAVFSRDPARARRIAAALQVGCVFINDFVRSSPELPFGGIKESGYGRELGAWGVHAFANIKTVVGG